MGQHTNLMLAGGWSGNPDARIKAVMKAWPKVTAKDIREMNELFPHYLFFRWNSQKDRVELHTSCCGRRETRDARPRTETPEHRALLEMLVHWNSGACPWCGRAVSAIDLSKARERRQLRAWKCAVLLHSRGGVLYADAVVLEKRYETERNLSAPPEYYLSSNYRFRRGEALQLDYQMSWRDDEPPVSWESGRIGRTKYVQEPFKKGSISFYSHKEYQLVGREALERNTFFRYCGYFDAWRNRPGHEGAVWFTDLISYLTAYSIYPRQVEMMVKAGLYRPIGSLIDSRKKWAGAMNWEEPDFRKSLGLSKPELKEFLALGGPMELLEIKRYVERHFGKRWSFDRAMLFEKDYGDAMEVLRYLKKHKLDPDRFSRYSEGVSYGDPYLFVAPDTVFELYRDYLDTAYMLGYCMEHGSVLWPEDLGAAHDAIAEELAKREEPTIHGGAEAKDLAKRRLKYEFELDGLKILVPIHAAAIKREGEILNHCVGGYAERHVKGVLTILFLRKAAAPHVPYVTIEMHGNQLAQIHGKNNDRGRVSPKVTHKAFLDTWLSWVQKGSPRDEDGRPKLPKKRRTKGAA